MSAPPGDSASIVRVTSVPDVVVTGAVRFTVPLALPPVSKTKLEGNVDVNPWSLVARIVKVPPAPLVFTVKGTDNVSPGAKTPFVSASNGRKKGEQFFFTSLLQEHIFLA